MHKVYEPKIRARLGTAAHFCEVVVLKLRTVPLGTALSGSNVIPRRSRPGLAGLRPHNVGQVMPSWSSPRASGVADLFEKRVKPLPAWQVRPEM